MQEIPLNSHVIRGAFQHRIAPIRIVRGYRSRLAAVLLGLGVLQALYVLLIAGVGYLTWLYTLSTLGFGVSLNLVTITFYVGPPVVGLIVILFLLKPLLIRPSRAPQPLQLARDHEPLLFDFVECVCGALGSPRPSRIFVDLRVNASASVPGWRGLFLGHLDLTIGLPLAAGMTLPQFTGVLSHEFGHFAQRTGLRSYFLIQSIQQWFGRVVHQRDGVDAWLDRQCDRRDWRIKAVAHLATFAVKASRKYLSLLMKAGAWISTAFSRQMEFDADRHEVAIVGVNVFQQTSRQIALLSHGLNLAWKDLAQDWSVGRLPEDLAQLAATHTQLLSDEASEQILSMEDNQISGRWDTHPCTFDRMINARAAGFEGIFHLEGVARSLFSDFQGLCRKASVHHYQTILKVEDDAVRLVPALEAIANAEAEREYEAAVQQLFSATSGFCSRWFRLPAETPRLLDEEENQNLADSCFDVRAYDQSVQTNMLHFAALIIRQSGIPVNPTSFRLPAADLETIRHEESVTTRNLNQAMEERRESATHIAHRIESTVARLLNGELGVAIPASRCTEIPDLKAAWISYGVLAQMQDEVMEVRRHYFAVQIVRENAGLFPAAVCANLIDDLETQAVSEIDRIVGRTVELHATVTFDPKLPLTIGGQLDAPGHSRTERIQSFLARIDVLLARLLGQLCWFTVAACPINEFHQPEDVSA